MIKFGNKVFINLNSGNKKDEKLSKSFAKKLKTYVIVFSRKKNYKIVGV